MVLEVGRYSPEGAADFNAPETVGAADSEAVVDQSVSEVGQQRWEAAKDIAGGAVEKVSEFGQQKWEAAKEFAAGVVENGQQRFDAISDRATNIGTRAKDSLKNFVSRVKTFGFALLAPDVAVKRGAEKTAEVSAKAYNWSAEKITDAHEFAGAKAEQLGVAAEAVKDRVVERVIAAKEKTAEKATVIKNSAVEKVQAWKQAYVEKVQARATEKQVAKLISQREIYAQQFEDLPATLEGLKAQIAHIEQMMGILPQRIEATDEIIKQLQSA